MRRAIALVLLGLACAAPARAGTPVPIPAKPQVASLDSEAPPGAPPHWLPGEAWVMQHWLPYDEARLYELLGVRRSDVWEWLRDDTRNLATLAEQRGWHPSALARALVADWTGDPAMGPAPGAPTVAELERRALRTLTQGHLSQHIFFHSLHQNAIPDNAPAIFGVASREQFQAMRRAELSPVQICRLHGIAGADAAQRAEATLRDMAARAVFEQQTPAAQAERLLRRQVRQLPRWLQQSRYNGPPPLVNPRASAATAANFSNNAVVSADGSTVAWESYEAAVAAAKSRGEINVLAAPMPVGHAPPAPLVVSQPLFGAGLDPRSSYNPAISADGRFVAYEAAQGNLNFAKRYGKMAIFVRDARRGVTTIASPAALAGAVPRSAYNPTISGDGRRIAYQSYVTSEDAPGAVELSVTDLRPRLRHRRLRIALADLGEPRLSAGGGVLTFAGRPSGEPHSRIYRMDLRTGSLAAVSDGSGDAYEPEISASGRFVVYTELRDGRSRVIADDAWRGTGEVVAPRLGDGLLADASASEPAISADGSTIAFTARDAKGQGSGVFARRGGETVLVSRAGAAAGPPAAGISDHPSVSGDGHVVTFTSDAWNLSAAKCNAARGIFARDLDRATTSLVSAGDGANRFLGAARGSSAPGDMTVALICA